MSVKQLFIIALVAAITSILVVVILRYFGFESPVTVAGGTAGALAGAIIAAMRTQIDEVEENEEA
jgi:hypothetical protein